MQEITSKLLEHLFDGDQSRRKEIVKKHGGKLKDAKDKTPFFVFKGETKERVRVVKFLIENRAFNNPEDFRYGALLLIGTGQKEDVILAYRLIKKYRKIGGEGKWWVADVYFDNKVDWGLTKEEFFKELEKEIGIDPKDLESR